MPQLSKGFKGKRPKVKKTFTKPLNTNQQEFVIMPEQHAIEKTYKKSKEVKPQDVFIGYKDNKKQSKKRSLKKV